MGIFNKHLTLEQLKILASNTMVEHLGIEFTAIGDDYVEARMPVDKRTHQPFGLLHGGASAALSETLASIAANFCVEMEKQYCVGLEVNANHIKSMRSGFVTGVTRPLHIGRRTHVWETRITNNNNELICVSRVTLAVLDKVS